MPRKICKTIKENRKLMKKLLFPGGEWVLNSKDMSTRGCLGKGFDGSYLFKTHNENFQIPLREIYYHKENHIRTKIINPENKLINAYFYKIENGTKNNAAI